jgi:hypothetical protein
MERVMKQKQTSQVLAEERIRRALDDIQHAQNLLLKAASELAAVVPGIRSWRSVLTQHRRVKELWYQVEAWYQRTRPKVDLDDANKRMIASRTGGGDEGCASQDRKAKTAQ